MKDTIRKLEMAYLNTHVRQINVSLFVIAGYLLGTISHFGLSFVLVFIAVDLIGAYIHGSKMLKKDRKRGLN